MYLGEFLFVLTPSPCGHSPYILLRKTQGGEGEVYISLSPRLRCYSKRPVMLRSTAGGEGEVYISLSPRLRCYSKRPVMLRSTAGGEGEMYIPFVSASMLFKTPRHVTGYGRRERVKKH